MILCGSDCIEAEHLPEELRQEERKEEIKIPGDREELKQLKKQAQQRAKEEIEKGFIIEALRQGEGNILRSAEKVGMDRRQFQNLVKKYGISRKDFLKD
jgi:DNA-binding NtrC family response regulator